MKSNKRSVSKTKENQGKSTPLMNKSNIVHSKQSSKENQPILSKNALELIDKISDERFKNIKSNLEKESKKTSLKVVNNVINTSKKPLHQSDGHPSNKYTSNNVSQIENKNDIYSYNRIKGNIKSNQTEIKEIYVKRIQRWFRRIIIVINCINAEKKNRASN